MSEGCIMRVLCVQGAEFEDDGAEQRRAAGREGAQAVAAQTARDREKAESFRLPVYLNAEFPSGMQEWFWDPDEFERRRAEIERVALPQWNRANGLRFVKAVSLRFEDATDDMMCESAYPEILYWASLV